MKHTIKYVLLKDNDDFMSETGLLAISPLFCCSCSDKVTCFYINIQEQNFIYFLSGGINVNIQSFCRLNFSLMCDVPLIHSLFIKGLLNEDYSDFH